MAKHTSGPWFYCEESGNVYIKTSSDEPAICHTQGIDASEADFEQAIENARLIAAAPELLRSLNEMVIEYEEGHGICRNEARRWERGPNYMRALNLIEKLEKENAITANHS